MVQVQKRQNAGIGARIPKKRAWLDGFESLSHEARSQPSSPFVEIAEDNSWPAKGRLVQNVRAEQAPNLLASFKKPGSQVNIEDVEDGRIANLEIGSQTAATLTLPPSYVVILTKLHRKAGEGHVPVRAAVEDPVFSETGCVALELEFNAARLVKLRPAVLYVEDLLDPDCISVQLLDYICYPLRVSATIKSPTFMDVVGRYSNAPSRHYCWRSSTQPKSSGARSSTGRRRHCSYVTRSLTARSVTKSVSSRSTKGEYRTARFTSSFRPKERLSKLVEPITPHTPSIKRIFAWIMAGRYSKISAPALSSLP